MVLPVNMGARLEIQGNRYGCYLVIGKAPSRVRISGNTIGYWKILCDCGITREMKVQALVSRKHFMCGRDCTLRGDAKKEVSCVECGSRYNIQNASIVKGRNSIRMCGACRAQRGVSAVRGKPAQNRLTGDQGNLNDLYGAYKRGAKNRGLDFVI